MASDINDLLPLTIDHLNPSHHQAMEIVETSINKINKNRYNLYLTMFTSMEFERQIVNANY